VTTIKEKKLSSNIAKMAEEAGVTPDEMRRVIKIVEERKRRRPRPRRPAQQMKEFRGGG
jgi:hypothetical protein